MPHRKSLEIAFRRWILLKSPSRELVSHLKIKNPIEYRDYLQKLFKGNMSWDNYGTVWNLDHIIPVSLFDLNESEEISLCWAKENILPTPKNNNRNKGASIEASYFIYLDRNINNLLLEERIRRELNKIYPNCSTWKVLYK